MSRRALFLAACLAAVATAPLAARADAVADFYSGKVVSLIIASGEGGYDAYGRLMARHLSKHIPGNPTMIAQQMPGAGGLQGINHVYNVAPRDGTVIGLVRRSAILSHITQPGATRFDIGKMNWLGNIAAEFPVSTAWHTAKAKRFEDLLKTELIVGGTGTSSVHETTPRLFNALIGTKYRIVGGYKGSGDLDLAMERGEIDGIAYDSWSNVKLRKADMLRRELLHVTLAFGLERNPELPAAPFALDFAKNEDDRQLMRLFFAQDAAARPMIAPPGVPADRLAALRRAFMALAGDADFLGDAQRSNLLIGLDDDRYMATIIDMVVTTPPALVDRLNRITTP